MAQPVKPVVYPSGDGWEAKFVDIKTGKEWSRAWGETRQEAIAAARAKLPKTSTIKKAIGWVSRHPILAGGIVGAWLAYRKGENILFGALIGAIRFWSASKVVKFVSGLIK